MPRPDRRTVLAVQVLPVRCNSGFRRRPKMDRQFLETVQVPCEDGWRTADCDRSKAAERKLPAIRRIAKIEPVCDAASAILHSTLNQLPGRPSVHAANHDVEMRDVRLRSKMLGHGCPIQPPKQVQPTDHHDLAKAISAEEKG